MSKVLVIGCGGVAGVAISKCCQVSEVFTELCIASRTKSKCDALAAKLAPITKTKITTAQVDAKLHDGSRHEHCPAVSGSHHYGCLPRLRC